GRRFEPCPGEPTLSPCARQRSGLMICGTPLSKAFISCGLRAPGKVRSEGLPRRDASWGLAGFTPGPRPTVRSGAAEGAANPGTGPPLLLGPLTAAPGIVEVPAPLCCCAAALLPVVPAEGEGAALWA